MRKLLLFLSLAAPVYAQSWSPVIGYENLNTFDIPAGTYVFQYGCGTTWTAPLTILGPQPGKQFTFLSFGLKSDMTCPGIAGAVGQPGIEVQQQAAGFSIGVHTWTGSAYGAAVATKIPALASTTPPPVTTPPVTTPVTTPAGCVGVSSVSYGTDGTVTIVISPYCMMIQQGGAYGFIQVGGYRIGIEGDPSLLLFNANSGTNTPH
jgi:hypothetical protein